MDDKEIYEELFEEELEPCDVEEGEIKFDSIVESLDNSLDEEDMKEEGESSIKYDPLIEWEQ